MTGYEQQLRLLYDAQDAAEAAARAEHGAGWVENNWITLAHGVLDAAPESVGQRAKVEFLRCNFLPTARPKPVDRSTDDG